MDPGLWGQEGLGWSWALTGNWPSKWARAVKVPSPPAPRPCLLPWRARAGDHPGPWAARAGHLLSVLPCPPQPDPMVLAVQGGVGFASVGWRAGVHRAWARARSLACLGRSLGVVPLPGGGVSTAFPIGTGFKPPAS